jgi:hypothetical protein
VVERRLTVNGDVARKGIMIPWGVFCAEYLWTYDITQGEAGEHQGKDYCLLGLSGCFVSVGSCPHGWICHIPTFRVTRDQRRLPETITQLARSAGISNDWHKSKDLQKAMSIPGAFCLVTATVSSTIVPARATTDVIKSKLA